MKIGELIKVGVAMLSDRESGVLDSEVLLGYALGEEREYLIAHADDDIADDGIEVLYFQYLTRVRDGESVAYVVGEKEFYGASFYVDKRVLVPRPETEMLVETVLKYMKARFDEEGRYNVLDVGTGSGCIAVSLALNAMSDNGVEMVEEIDAVDISDDAIDVARENVRAHGVDHLVNVMKSDLLADMDEDVNYDIIVANLPYIGEKENVHVDADVEAHEPNGALFGGANGLELYDRMFVQIGERGVLPKLIVGEFGFGQSDGMADMLEKYFPGKWGIGKDLAGIDRMFVVEL